MPFTKQIPCRSIFAVFRRQKHRPILQYRKEFGFGQGKGFVFINQENAVINVFCRQIKWAHKFLKPLFLPGKRDKHL
jgi:hypothetical protein